MIIDDILLVVVNGYFINGYWWLLMTIINNYFINGCWWLLMVI
jgi:hypothetical protein